MRRPLTTVAVCATALVSFAMVAPAAQAVDGQQKPGHYTFADIRVPAAVTERDDFANHNTISDSNGLALTDTITSC